jgi:5-methylcytosine-specific restriction endonuclease McrA
MQGKLQRKAPRRARQNAYRRLLRDPRWQRRRLQIFARDDWTCQQCRAQHRTLHVHHEKYLPGKAPWEVPARYLVTLCVTCHEKHHKKGRP